MCPHAHYERGTELHGSPARGGGGVVLPSIQGGPERMQQLRSLTSRTSSINRIFFSLGRKFIFQHNDTMTINFG